MFAPKATRVIYLHMAGSPSQLELFEHKPDLRKLHIKDCPPSFLEGKRFAFIKGVPKLLAGQFQFERHGQPRNLTNPDRNNLAPRLGVAFALTPKTVCRGKRYWMSLM